MPINPVVSGMIAINPAVCEISGLNPLALGAVRHGKTLAQFGLFERCRLILALKTAKTKGSFHHISIHRPFFLLPLLPRASSSPWIVSSPSIVSPSPSILSPSTCIALSPTQEVKETDRQAVRQRDKHEDPAFPLSQELHK